VKARVETPKTKLWWKNWWRWEKWFEKNL